MARRALVRIRKHADKLRHVRRNYLAGTNVPGIVEVDNGDTSFNFTFTQMGPNVPAALLATWAVSGTPAEASVALAPGLTPTQIAAAAEVVLDAAGVPSTATAGALAVPALANLADLTFQGA